MSVQCDESLEALSPAGNSAYQVTESRAHEIDMRIDVEDEIEAELTSTAETTVNQRIFNPKVLVKGVEKSKAHALKDFSKYRQHASSTDRLKLSRTVFSRTFSIVLRPSCDIPACSRPFPCVL